MNYVIIVAGGKGLRMGSDIPKQFLPVCGSPVLMRTLQVFHSYDEGMQIILVLPAHQRDYWHQLCHDYQFNIPHLLANGGATRFDSVKNGLSLIADDEKGFVAVHDGVRPFVSPTTLQRCFQRAKETEAVVPAVPSAESLRQIKDGEQSVAVDRSLYRLIQTPQVFTISLLKAAYSLPFRTTFTDDASVVESYGHQVVMVDGNVENIKITTPFDLIVAKALIERNA